MKIRDIARQYVGSRSECIPLVASENSTSSAVKALCASGISERYYVGPAAPWRYPRETFLEEIVSQTEQLATRIFGGKKSSVAPLSGSQCVAAIVLGACQPGDVIMGLSAADGGHWALRSMAGRLQCRFEPLPLTARSRVDSDQLAELIKKSPPKLVMVDPSHSVETIPPESIRTVLPANIPLFYDISHFMGLVPHQYLLNPFGRGITALHGSTHKSFFGPQKGLITFGDNAEAELVAGISATAEKILSSNTHLHHIAALGQALEEYEAFGAAYAASIVKHACLFAQTLKNQGLNVLSAQNALTESHQVLVKVDGEVPRLWQELTGAGILANPIRPPRENSLGFRFGIAEVTRLGYAATEVEEAALLAAGMINGTLDSKDAKVRIKELATRPRTMKFCFEETSP